MRQLKLLLGTIALLVSITGLFGQTLRYPATTTVLLTQPYPVFLDDYTASGSNKLNVRLTFNDFNETSRDVYVRLYIESQNIKIQTRADYIPVSPINLIPGSPLLLSGSELFSLLDYSHIDIIGSSREDLIKTGRLPEGIYTFSAEIYDYKSHQPISLKGSATASLRMNDPPVVVLPKSGSVIKPQEVQNITFQWQTNNIDPGTVQFQLALYEIADGADPLSAISNGQATQIFLSDNTDLNSFNYDATAPLLTKGKRYAFTVLASSSNGKQIFRNEGKSQIYWFYYGYPEGGNIPLIFPSNKYNFSIRSNKYFEWGTPDNLTNNQPVIFKLKIAHFDGVDPDKSIEEASWYDEDYAVTYTPRGNYCSLSKNLEPKTDYVWQVKGWSDDQMVAKSKTYIFSGPPVIEEFFAGVHKVEVISTDNSNLSDLSGWGRIELIKDGISSKIRFEHLTIKNNAGINSLVAGQICSKLDSFPIIKLSPEKAENKEAKFAADSVRIDKNGIDIKGVITWDFPFAVRSPDKPIVRSLPYWFSFNSLKITGVATLDPNNDFQLLDPGNMRMKLSESSMFIIYENIYRLEFKGSVDLPSNVKGSINQTVSIPFYGAGQLFYIVSDTLNFVNPIKVVPNTGINMVPRVVHIDLSEKTSPFAFSNDPAWKGVYFEQFDIAWDKRTDYNGQLTCTDKYTHKYADSEKSRCWVDAQGLQLIVEKSFEESDLGKFNTFPCNYKSYYLKSENSVVINSYLMGTIRIPILSESTDFAFTVPISTNGFQTGYLDETLDGKKYVFNDAGGDEQRMYISVNRAVFADQERVDMNLTIEWPYLNITFQNVDGFSAWGDYEIGFGEKKGATTLATQMATQVKGFKITIDFIGAGRTANLYAIGTSASMVMGEDVAGANGAPVVNLYSIAKNEMLDGVYLARAKAVDNSVPTTNGSSELGSVDDPTVETKNYQQLSDALSNLSKLTITQPVSPFDTPEDTASATVSTSILTSGAVSQPVTLNAEQEQLLSAMVQLLANRISAPYAAKANTFTKKISDKLKAQKDSLVNKIKNYANDSIMPSIENAVLGVTEGIEYEGIDIGQVVTDICVGTLSVAVDSIINGINNYVDLNVFVPLATSGGRAVTNATYGVLYSLAKEIVINKSDINITDAVSNSLLAGVESAVNVKGLKSQIKTKAKEFTDRFLTVDNLKNIAVAAFMQQVGQQSAKAVTQKAAEVIGDALGETGGAIAENVAANVDFDFSNLGDKLKSGRIDQIIKFDPSYIKIETKVAILEGQVDFFEDDPEWGNSWQATITAQILISPSFSAMVRYINGSKKGADSTDFKFWLLQLGAYGLGLPMSPLPLTFDGAEGLVYHHMKKVSEDVYTPDSETKFGVGLKAFFFDTGSKGQTVIFNVGLEVAFLTNGFIMELNGDVLLANKIDDGKVKKSFIKAKGLIQYNSVERHFLANLVAEMDASPMICGSGEFCVDIKPGSWMVAFGTRDKPIQLKLLCAEYLTSTSWLQADNSKLDFGYIFKAQVDLKSPWIGPKAFRVQAYFLLKYEFGVATLILWKPEFGISEAMIWLDIYAGIGINYETLIKSGNFEIAAVGLGGSVLFRTIPNVYIKGNLYGHAVAMGMGVDFDLALEKTF